MLFLISPEFFLSLLMVSCRQNKEHFEQVPSRRTRLYHTWRNFQKTLCICKVLQRNKDVPHSPVWAMSPVGGRSLESWLSWLLFSLEGHRVRKGMITAMLHTDSCLGKGQAQTRDWAESQLSDNRRKSMQGFSHKYSFAKVSSHDFYLNTE